MAPECKPLPRKTPRILAIGDKFHRMVNRQIILEDNDAQLRYMAAYRLSPVKRTAAY